MIFLIDDKRKRQEVDYGWSPIALNKYSQILTAVYSYEEINEYSKRNTIFSQNNIIIFHESFFDNSINQHVKESVDIREKLKRFAAENNGWVVFFSGSKSSRTLEGRVAHLPVSVMYENLKGFIEKVIEGSIDLKVLLFGINNPEIEEVLLNTLKTANNRFDEAPINSYTNSLLFLAGNRTDVPVILDNSDEQYIALKDKNSSESNWQIFNDKGVEILSVETDRIFVPLCFGPSLSDYNGLQFACHIRCTDTVNRLKPIFIYGFVDYSYLIDNEYFNILKVKNVFLIDYSRKAFVEAVSKELMPLALTQLSKELGKLKLDVPNNYEDSHSIANEWAIYRWATALGAIDGFIEKINHRIGSELYYKYLKTIYPTSEISKISQEKLKIQYIGKPKILYVDDDANKGWYKIISTLLYDVNNIKELDYLGGELKGKSKEEVVDLVTKRIEVDNIDIVILDFRLHSDDFMELNNSDISGIKILKAVKKINPGVQVIIFSATNKVWNMQRILDAGADGFTVKESPENGSFSNFTNEIIIDFISTIESCLSKIFLKDFYSKLRVLKGELIPRKNYKKSNIPLPKEFVDEVLKWLELSNKLLSTGITHTSLTSSFLFMFSILENLANRVIDVENPIPIADKPDKYKFEFRLDNKYLIRFREDDKNEGYFKKTKWVLESKRNLPWTQKILNTLYYITEETLSEGDIYKLVELRNTIVHANSTTGSKIDITPHSLISLHNIIYIGLKNVK